jgi:hypothetical protein
MPESHQRIWWAIYHGDRFTSLLLGLPSGFSDKFYDLEASVPLMEPIHCDTWLHQFVLNCAIVAGQVIDRNINPTHSSINSGRLGERMKELSDSAPDGWWDLPSRMPSRGPSLDDLVDRLLMQFFFFHVQMYIYLPRMSAGGGGIPDENDRKGCAFAARELVKRFLLLRSQADGSYIFDCKTSDFVGFTATVTLLLWIHTRPQQSQDGDRRLIMDAEDIFRQLKRETACTVASQCLQTIQLLAPWRSERPSSNQQREIRIPYFGNVVRKRPEGLSSVASPDTPHESHLSNRNGQGIDYLSYCVPTQTFNDFLGRFQDFHGYPTDEQSFWMDGTIFDIDQGWNMFPLIYDASVAT